MLCSYDGNAAELLAVVEDIDDISISLSFPCSINATILQMFNYDLRTHFGPYRNNHTLYQMRMADLERLNRFQTRTVPSFSNSMTLIAYQEGIFRLVSLVGSMHIGSADLALTLVLLASISITPSPKPNGDSRPFPGQSH